MSNHVRVKKTQEKTTYRSPDFHQRPATSPIGGQCPNCGAQHTSTAQICPECGMGLGGNLCTFCGAPMAPGTSECAACGASREGVECPNCGTINFRNFCRSCNRPITKRGEAAMAKFKSHPKYKAAEKINDSLAKLADFIDGKIPASDPEIVSILSATVDDGQAPVSEPDQASGKSSSSKPLLKKPAVFSKPRPKAEVRNPFVKPKAAQEILSEPTPSASAPLTIEEAMELYRQKKAEMDNLLDSILPDSDSTPEEQRDFYSVRMTVVTRKYKKLEDFPVAWICNFCGYRHNAPQECAEPWHGGTWVHETREVTYEVSKLEKME